MRDGAAQPNGAIASGVSVVVAQHEVEVVVDEPHAGRRGGADVDLLVGFRSVSPQTLTAKRALFEPAGKYSRNGAKVT